MNRIDKSSPVPLYYQLYTILLDEIKNGSLKPGDMLPTEAALMEEYTLSRSTVRQAILDLARKGYVSREKSKGTYVLDASRSLSYSDRVRGFSLMSDTQGRQDFVNTVLASQVIEAPAHICKLLNIKRGAKAFYLKRVRSIDGVPVVYAEDWISYDRCPGIETLYRAENSLLTTLENQFGIVACHARRTLECSYAENDEQMNMLKVKASHAMLHLTSVVTDESGTPVDVCFALINGRYTAHE